MVKDDDHHVRTAHPPYHSQEQPVKILSHIHPVWLEESIGGFEGRYTSFSILEPIMRIERSGPLDASNKSRAVYRIVLHFTIQFAIIGFDSDRETKRHNRIFDSITVRYLYRAGERQSVLPRGDGPASNIQATTESGNTDDFQAGLSTAGGEPAPSFTVHAQHASKLSYERTLKSWRKGLVFERYPPPDPSHKERGMAAFLSRLADTALDDFPSLFRVHAPHALRCLCRRPRSGRCKYRESRRRGYDRAAHWSGQAQAQLHLWTPEIYQNMNCPLTVMKEVDADLVDRILAERTLDGLEVLKQLLHFDFDIEARLREIGWGFWSLFRSAAKPPEIRAKDDSGKPLSPDCVRVCIACCAEDINWPQYETRDLQAEVEDIVSGSGSNKRPLGYVKRLMSADEYQAAYNARITENGGQSGQPQQSGSRGRQPTRPVPHEPGSQQTPRRIAFSPDGYLRNFRTGVASPRKPAGFPRAPTPPSRRHMAQSRSREYSPPFRVKRYNAHQQQQEQCCHEHHTDERDSDSGTHHSETRHSEMHHLGTQNFTRKATELPKRRCTTELGKEIDIDLEELSRILPKVRVPTCVTEPVEGSRRSASLQVDNSLLHSVSGRDKEGRERQRSSRSSVRGSGDERPLKGDAGREKRSVGSEAEDTSDRKGKHSSARASARTSARASTTALVRGGRSSMEE